MTAWGSSVETVGRTLRPVKDNFGGSLWATSTRDVLGQPATSSLD
jgi:hypothetical protein